MPRKLLAAFSAAFATLLAALTTAPMPFFNPFTIPLMILLPMLDQSMLNGFLICWIKSRTALPILENMDFRPEPKPLIMFAPVLNKFSSEIVFRIAWTISPALAMIVGMLLMIPRPSVIRICTPAARIFGNAPYTAAVKLLISRGTCSMSVGSEFAMPCTNARIICIPASRTDGKLSIIPCANVSSICNATGTSCGNCSTTPVIRSDTSC